jgi:hypothetical protein
VRRGVMRSLIGISVLAFPACALVLDFDELQKGGPAAGSGGSDDGMGNGGETSQAGSGGAADGPCGSCDDHDPCTLDSCDAEADPPECLHEYQPGLASDGFRQKLSSDLMVKTTLATGPDAFYVSQLSLDGEQPVLTLYRLTADADELETVADLSTLQSGSSPISAAGLVADTSASLRLRAYVALKEQDGPAGVYLATFDRDMQLTDTELIEESYDPGTTALAVLRSPIAWFVGGKAWGAWPNLDGGVSLHSPGRSVETLGLASPTAAQRPAALSPVASGSEPGVLWTGTEGGVFVQLRSQGTPADVEECTTNPGGYLSAASVNVGITGFWLTSWTKVSDDLLVSESAPVFCDEGCSSVPPDCSAGDSTAELVRNQAFTAFLRPGDPAGVAYLATATPYLTVGDQADAIQASLQLNLARIDFGSMPLVDDAEVETLSEITLATRETSTGASLAGPDYPVLGAVAPDKLLVGWSDPDDDGESTLTLERYTLCFPED